MQGILVQTHQAVGEIIVVDQHQVRHGYLHQLRNWSGGPRQIQLHAVGAHHLACVRHHRIQTHGDAVVAQLTRAGRGTQLLHREGEITAVLHSETRADGVDAGSL